MLLPIATALMEMMMVTIVMMLIMIWTSATTVTIMKKVDMDTAFIDADESVENETNEEDLSKDMRDFDQVVESFKECVREQWEDPTVKGAVKTFRNNFRKTLDNDSTLVHVMFNFAKETSQNINVGRKRKHGYHIPVQSTVKVRRRFQNPGRGTATYGRKERDLRF